MVQAVRYVQSKYGDKQPSKEKTWLGLAELRQLLDHEAIHNRCIELSEEHQVLWCIGRFTALRPGSLCPSNKYGRTKPLTWRNFSFAYGKEPGMFDVRLILDRINIKRSNDPLVAGMGPTSHAPAIRMTSPEP